MIKHFILTMFVKALVSGTSIKMDFLSAGTVRCDQGCVFCIKSKVSILSGSHVPVCRTDPLEFSQTGACLSDHVHRFYGAVSDKTMRPEVRSKQRE